MAFPSTLAAVIDNVARKTIGKDWNLYSMLLRHWGEIVGEEYARVTTPVKVSFPKGKAANEKWTQGHRTDGVLHIRLPQGMTMEFAFHSEQIRQRIASFCGFEAIEKIALETYYYTPPPNKDDGAEPLPRKIIPIPESINDIENEELRAALESLAKSMP